MNNGNMNNNNKNNENYVRCVREHEFTFQELYQAYKDCRKNKRNTMNALKFETDLESNLYELVTSLNNKTYTPTRSVCFSITDPKPREVFAANFKDRIVHHLLYNHLNPIFEKIFIYDSYASRKNKGTLSAVKRAQTFTRRVTNNSKENAYFLQLDIHNFFMSIDKNILFSLLNKKIKDKNLLWLTSIIIFHNPTSNYIQKGIDYKQAKVPEHKTLFNAKENKGLPIGNLTSQFFANVYLNELDQFIKHKLKIKHYVRYVDDFVIFSKSREELLSIKQDIETFLQNSLKLKLKPLIILKPISSGINFVGYIIKPNYLLPRNRNINNIYKKINNFKKNNISVKDNYTVYDFKNTESLLNSLNSYFGYLKHSKHKSFVEKLKQNKFLNEYFVFEKNKIKHKYSNKITNFLQQHFFFKSYNKDSLVLLDVGKYYRVLKEDSIFLSRKYALPLNKTKNYFYVNLLKNFSLYDTKRTIVTTTKQNHDLLHTRQINKIYNI